MTQADKGALNALYAPLETKRAALVKRLRGKGFQVSSGWFNGHYSRDSSGEYTMEYFPIPVISVAGLCDIELHFEELTVSAKLSRRQALEHTFAGLEGYAFEAYGIRDYLKGFYFPGQDLDTLRQNILSSDEEEVGFSFAAELENVTDLVALLRGAGFYY